MLRFKFKKLSNLLRKREIIKAILVLFCHMGCEEALKAGVSALLWQSVITPSVHLDILFYWADKCEVAEIQLSCTSLRQLRRRLECLAFEKKYKCKCSETCIRFCDSNTEHESHRSVCMNSVSPSYSNAALTEPLAFFEEVSHYYASV